MSELVRRLLLVVMLGLLAALAGCDEVDQEINDAIRDKTGLDAKDPVQMAGAAAGGSLLGNQEEKDAIDLVRALRRVEHEQKAAELARAKEYEKALAELDQALSWNFGKDSVKTGELHVKKFHVYQAMGDKLNAERERQRGLAQWASAEQAAAAKANAGEGAKAWAKLASSYYSAHAKKQACDAARKAWDLDDRYEDYWLKMRCDASI